MSNQAPVCLITPVLSQDQPPPVNFPSIPQATNLASALAAINAMALTLRMLTGQMGHAFQGLQGTPGRAGAAGKPAPKGGKYTELKPRRITSTVKVASKDDPSTFVVFKRIDALTFQDNKTKELWTWQRGPNNAPD